MEHLEQKINQLSDLVKSLTDTMNVTNSQVQRMNFHLFNDDGAGVVGTIKKVDDLDKRVERIETENKIRKATYAIWGSVGGGLVLFGEKLLSYIQHIKI